MGNQLDCQKDEKTWVSRRKEKLSENRKRLDTFYSRHFPALFTRCEVKHSRLVRKTPMVSGSEVVHQGNTFLNSLSRRPDLLNVLGTIWVGSYVIEAMRLCLVFPSMSRTLK